MVLDKIKGKYSEYKESSMRKKELKEEKKALDDLLKEKAKARADELYQQNIAEERQQYMKEKEQKYIDEELKKRGGTSIYSDTRTTGEKFKEGFSKVSQNIGVVGGRDASDTSEIVRESDLQAPEPEKFGESMEGTLGRSRQPARYSTRLPKMAKSQRELPYTEQNNMFFRSGPLFDNSDQLGTNLNEFSQKMKTPVPDPKSLNGGKTIQERDFMSKFRLGGSFGSGLNLGGKSDEMSFSEKFLGVKKTSNAEDKLRRFL